MGTGDVVDSKDDVSWKSDKEFSPSMNLNFHKTDDENEHNLMTT